MTDQTKATKPSDAAELAYGQVLHGTNDPQLSRYRGVLAALDQLDANSAARHAEFMAEAKKIWCRCWCCKNIFVATDDDPRCSSCVEAGREIPGAPEPGHVIAEAAAAAVSALAGETQLRAVCPCVLIGPCRPACSCASPVQSGGCDRCATFGDKEGRIEQARFIADAIAEKQRLEEPDGHDLCACGHYRFLHGCKARTDCACAAFMCKYPPQGTGAAGTGAPQGAGDGHKSKEAAQLSGPSPLPLEASTSVTGTDCEERSTYLGHRTDTRMHPAELFAGLPAEQGGEPVMSASEAGVIRIQKVLRELDRSEAEAERGQAVWEALRAWEACVSGQLELRMPDLGIIAAFVRAVGTWGNPGAEANTPARRSECMTAVARIERYLRALDKCALANITKSPPTPDGSQKESPATNEGSGAEVKKDEG